MKIIPMIVRWNSILVSCVSIGQVAFATDFQLRMPMHPILGVNMHKHVSSPIYHVFIYIYGSVLPGVILYISCFYTFWGNVWQFCMFVSIRRMLVECSVHSVLGDHVYEHLTERCQSTSLWMILCKTRSAMAGWRTRLPNYWGEGWNRLNSSASRVVQNRFMHLTSFGYHNPYP